MQSVGLFFYSLVTFIDFGHYLVFVIIEVTKLLMSLSIHFSIYSFPLLSLSDSERGHAAASGPGGGSPAGQQLPASHPAAADSQVEAFQ